MLSRVVKHLRHNVVAYVALFFAISGTAVAVGLPRNSVNSRHIVDGGVRRADVANNAINAARVRDVERSVSIPLGSFWDCEQAGVGRDLDWTNDADGNADRFSNNFEGVIRWDDVTGSGDDQSTVCAEFMVPTDAVDDVELRVHAGKQQELGPTVEQITGNVDGHTHTEDMVAGTAPTTYTFPTDIGFTSGDTIKVSISAHSPVGSILDDGVDVYSVDFVYRATQ